MYAKIALHSILALSLSVGGFSASGSSAIAQSKRAAARPSPKAMANFGHLPLSFEQNTGQAAPNVQWLARGPESTLYLSGNDATVQIHHFEKVKRDGVELPRARSASLRMSLLSAQPALSSQGEDPQPGKANYFTGNDSSRWQKDVPLYGQVRLNGIYPGVSLLYHGERGQLEYDFVVAPHADPGRIALGFTGATPELASNGDLLLPLPGESPVRFEKPVVYQLKDGARTPVDSSYLIAADGHVSFQLGAYDHQRELVIDPTLVFLGTLGAGNYPYATNLGQITVDPTGAMYFIGTTNDPTYPVTSGAYQGVCGPATGSDASSGGVYCGTYGATSAYVSKISADGTTLVYSTYLSGGGGYEQGTSIAVDSNGIAYLLGATASNNFPITSDAFQKLCQPGQNPGFVPVAPPTAQCNNFGNGGGTEYTVNGPVLFFAKLSADGSSLIYSSFLGGTSAAYPVASALDSAGNWYLYGQTSVLLASNVYPGPGANQVQFPGVSTSGYQTVSTAYYNTLANQLTVPENINNAGVLSKFSNDGHTLLYGTFFADETNGYDFSPTSLAIGANGVAFIGGYSSASQIPTTQGALKMACTTAGSPDYTCTTVDGLVAAFDTTKSGTASLVYSTRIGGTATSQGSNIPNQEVLGIAADPSNDAYVTGYTYDQTFPVPSTGYINSCNTANPNNVNNCLSAFVLELNPAGTSILAGSFLTGPAAYYESSVGYKVLLDTNQLVYLYGTSQDGYNSFPLVNPVQGYSNNNEIYVAAMSSDLTKLLFSTRLGNPSLMGGNAVPVNGLALDPNNNIYFAASTQDTNFAATSGTYTTAANSGTENHTFFGKISPILALSSTSLTIAPSSANTGQSVTFTALVTSTAKSATVPTGTVIFSNTAVTPAAQLGTGTLDGTGTATFNTTSLAAGTYTVTAAYSGDTVYDNSVSASQSLTIVTPPPPPPADFSLAPATATVSVAAAGTVTDVLTITPLNSFSAATTFACSGLPANATCTFSPSSVTPGGGAATTTLTITTGVSSASAAIAPAENGTLLARLALATSGTSVALLFLPALLMSRKRRAQWLRLSMMIIVVFATMQFFTGCGGSKSSGSGGNTGTGSTSSTNTPAGTSTVTVTATSGTLSHSAMITLTVQ